MKALRLPSRVSTVAYLVRFRRPRFTPSVRVSPWRSRKIGGFSQARALGQPASQFSGSSLRGHGWVLSGLQAIHPVPLLRSWTPVESACPRHSGHVDAAPAIRTTRASALVDFEADSRSFGTCSPTLSATIAVTRKAGFRLAELAFTGRELNPLDHDGRFQLVFTTILLPCPPDATGLHDRGYVCVTNLRHNATSGATVQSGAVRTSPPPYIWSKRGRELT